ncbi:MAG: hypothetical protein AAGI72_01550 [Pseudomonadota bacterium]
MKNLPAKLIALSTLVCSAVLYSASAHAALILDINFDDKNSGYTLPISQNLTGVEAIGTGPCEGLASGTSSASGSALCRRRDGVTLLQTDVFDLAGLNLAALNVSLGASAADFENDDSIDISIVDGESLASQFSFERFIGVKSSEPVTPPPGNNTGFLGTEDDSLFLPGTRFSPFQDFSFDFDPSGFADPSSLRLQIRLEVSSNAERVGVDAIQILSSQPPVISSSTAGAVPAPASAPLVLFGALLLRLPIRRRDRA